MSETNGLPQPTKTKVFAQTNEFWFEDIIVTAWRDRSYPPRVSLAHQCDEWEIGNSEQVECFISRLRDVLSWIHDNLPETDSLPPAGPNLPEGRDEWRVGR